jgi:RNA polymerase sigma factor (sigma-70 family)
MTTLSKRGLDDDLTRTIKEAQDGNQEAWDRLFREYYPKVCRAARRKLDRSGRSMRSVYESSDFANDVMKSLVANLSRLDFPSSEHLVAFLAQVAEQKVIDEHRRRRTLKRDVTRERRLEGATESTSVQLASDEPTASQHAQANEAEALLMDRGSETEKRIIELRREGYDNNDIADQTGWNVRKVQRFLKDLHESLPGQGR